MRVLLIAYHFPPDPAVGAIRAGRIAASLVAAGHQVDVLSIRENGLPATVEQDDVQVRRVRRAIEPRRILVGLKGLVSRRSNGRRDGAIATGGGRNGSDAMAGWRPPTEVSTWRRYLGSVLWLPDDQQGWIPSVVAAGLRQIAQGVDVIYTTAPPFSTHVAGLLLKTMSGLPWVAELRDPWIGNPWKPWFVRSLGADTVDAWLERQCMRNADRVVAVTASAARELSERQGEPGSVVLVRNGIPTVSETDTIPPADEAAERSVVYLGTLYHNRDPRPFLQGVAHLRRAGRLPPVRVEFIGNCSHFTGIDLAALCTELGIADVVRFVPPIPHSECQERIRSADLLLLLAQDQPSQVPQKLYEYLATGRPVIAFADEEGETSEMLRDVGGHYLVTASAPEEIADVLATALDAERRHTAADPLILREWSAERQMQRLVRLVEEVGA